MARARKVMRKKRDCRGKSNEVQAGRRKTTFNALMSSGKKCLTMASRAAKREN